MVACLFLLTLLTGGCFGAPDQNMDIRDNDLYQDLTADSRDSMFCAMSYIERRGGPSIAGASRDVATLLAMREPMEEWLLAQAERDSIASDYLEYRDRWNPVFED